MEKRPTKKLINQNQSRTVGSHTNIMIEMERYRNFSLHQQRLRNIKAFINLPNSRRKNIFNNRRRRKIYTF